MWRRHGRWSTTSSIRATHAASSSRRSKAPRRSDRIACGGSTGCGRCEPHGGSSVAVTEVKAELVGNLWKIVVEVGQRVEEDDTLMILESMKMEIPITTPVTGTVSEIRVKEGEVVQEGQTVAVVTPD